MTASYGRPGVSPVQALFTPSKPNQLQASNSQQVNVGASGRIVDMSSPEVAGNNAAQPFMEIASLLKQVGETGVKAAKLYVKDQVQEELGKVASQPEMLEAYRKGEQEARDWTSSFRPQTQNLVNQAAATSSISQYNDVFLARTQTSGILKSPYSSEEDRSAELARIKADAAKESGFEFIPPRYLGEQVDKVMLAESGAKGQLEKLRAAEQFTDQNATLSNGFGAQLIQLSTNLNTPAALNNPEESQQKTSEWFRNSIEMLQQARTPQEAGQILMAGFSNAYAAAVSGGELADLQQGQQLLTTMTKLSNLDVRLANGQKLSDVALKDGKTIGTALSELEFKLQPVIKKAQEDQAWQNSMPIFRQALGGDTDGARAQAERLLPQLFSDPRQLASAISTLNGISEYAIQPTRSQKEEMALLRLDMEKPGMSWEQQKNLILNSGLTIEQKLALAGQVQNPTSNDSLISSAASFNSLEATQAGEDIALAQSNALASGGLAQGTTIQSSEQATRTAIITAKERTQEELQRRAAAGEPALDKDGVNALFKSKLEEYTQEQLANYGKQADKPLSPGERVTGMLSTVQANLVANGGKPIREVFPPALRKQAVAAGYPDTYLGVQKFFLQQMNSVTEDNGKGGKQKVFTRPAETYRQMTQRANQQLGRPEGQQLGELAPAPGRPILGEGRWTYQPPGSKLDFSPKQQPAKGNEQSSTKGAGLDMGQWIGQTLNALAGVSPANASEMDMPGMQNLAVLAKLARTNQRPTLDTPVLPQANHQAKAAAVPVAIKNDKNPFFIAIGINEGTRTANGGYTQAYYGHTDPGNGKRNVGTVSAQQGGTPGTSDRRWAGLLTGTATVAQPFLARLGVKPGTVGFNRLMFNVMDLRVQAPAAVGDFIKRIPQLIKQGLTIEAIAKARADSFFIPGTNRLDAPGFGNSYSRLFADQRSRAGTFDYKRRV